MKVQQLIKQFISSPELFLVVIAFAIGWQQLNSKKLAKEAGQENTQAWFFSIIMSLSIFLCVANGIIRVAIIGAIIETLVNILLVLKTQHPKRLQIRFYKDQLADLESKERKGKEIEEISKKIKDLRIEIGILPTTIKIFIGMLIPTFIVFMSELYISNFDY